MFSIFVGWQIQSRVLGFWNTVPRKDVKTGIQKQEYIEVLNYSIAFSIRWDLFIVCVLFSCM